MLRGIKNIIGQFSNPDTWIRNHCIIEAQKPGGGGMSIKNPLSARLFRGGIVRDEGRAFISDLLGRYVTSYVRAFAIAIIMTSRRITSQPPRRSLIKRDASMEMLHNHATPRKKESFSVQSLLQLRTCNLNSITESVTVSYLSSPSSIFFFK